MHLLIVGDLRGQLSGAAKIAMDRGVQVAHAPDVASGIAAMLKGLGADLAMIDIRCDVRAFIVALKKRRLQVPVVACGGASDAHAAADAVKAGALEFIPLPPDAALIAAVFAAVADRESAMIFRDPAMRQVMDLIERVAPSDSPVLIVGESGVGKEVAARSLHRLSRRADKPFIALNCAAIPENLLESELFGYEKGAFTGAVGRRIGKFEQAHGGTILLDEISELDIRLQAKLLRALQERVIERLGSDRPVAVDLRVLATSNRDMPAAIAEGRFRADLYYRLNAIELRLPPLRERKDDIVPLAEIFIKRYAAANRMEPKPLSRQALQWMRDHSWPGNVRELENAMQRAVLLARKNPIEREAVQPQNAGAPDAPGQQKPHDAGAADLVGKTIADVERSLIADTLGHCGGDRHQAAALLGISIRTLRNKLKACRNAQAVDAAGLGA